MALQREADPEGIRLYLALLNGGRSKYDLLKDILDSQEARALPSANTLQAALTTLSTPKPASARPLSVAELHALIKMEQRSFVEQAYRVILGRNPDPDGRNHYESRLARGRTKGRIVAEISRSQEARQRPRTIAAAIMLLLLRHF